MIKRCRTEPEPPLPKAKPKRRPTPPVWRQLKLNKNLCNFPLARSARTKAKWNKDGQGWWCKLPGENRIELAVAADTPQEKRRLPTDFDMNVLYRLLVAVQDAWPQWVERVTFDSKAAFLRDLHLTKNNKNRRRLLSSLDLWSNLSIHFVQWKKHPAPWHVPGQSQPIAKDLAPPIRSFEFRGRKIVVTLDREWVKLAKPKGYFALAPFPLPREATAQNLALYILAWMFGEDVLGEVTYRTNPIKKRTLCHKIGLRARKERLEKIVEIESKWFAQRNTFGVSMIDGDDCVDAAELRRGHVVFLLERPRVPRRKKT